jgi:menaquinone-dependent protoporphyrinogen oxidase
MGFPGNTMRALIVYGTTEGQTHKIAERIASRIRELGHEAQLHDSSALLDSLQIGVFEAIIIAASVHQQLHQETITGFAIAHREQLKAKPTAFVSVSLSAALESDHLEAQKYVDRFVAETGWRPTKTLLLAGALRYTGYDYFMQQIVKYIVMKGGGSADTERDYEFTDWEALSKFVDSYLEMVGAGHS